MNLLLEKLYSSCNFFEKDSQITLYLTDKDLSCSGHMSIGSKLLASISMATTLTIAVIIVVIPFSSNLATIANAQQQEQPTNQSEVTEDATTTAAAQSAKDSFRVQVPQGWIIHDVNNTGFTLISEVMQGYGILAQLCPEEQQQQQQLPSPNVVDPKGITCQEAGEEIIHIIRYPSLGAILDFSVEDLVNDFDDTAATILSYQIQKLREVGYNDIEIVNNTDTTIPVDLNPPGMNNNDDNNDDIELPAASGTQLSLWKSHIGLLLLQMKQKQDIIC